MSSEYSSKLEPETISNEKFNLRTDQIPVRVLNPGVTTDSSHIGSSNPLIPFELRGRRKNITPRFTSHQAPIQKRNP